MASVLIFFYPVYMSFMFVLSAFSSIRRVCCKPVDAAATTRSADNGKRETQETDSVARREREDVEVRRVELCGRISAKRNNKRKTLVAIEYKLCIGGKQIFFISISSNGYDINFLVYEILIVCAMHSYCIPELQYLFRIALQEEKTRRKEAEQELIEFVCFNLAKK